MHGEGEGGDGRAPYSAIIQLSIIEGRPRKKMERTSDFGMPIASPSLLVFLSTLPHSPSGSRLSPQYGQGSATGRAKFSNTAGVIAQHEGENRHGFERGLTRDGSVLVPSPSDGM